MVDRAMGAGAGRAWAAGDLPLAPSGLTPERVAAALDGRDAALAALADGAEIEDDGAEVLLVTVAGSQYALPLDRVAAVLGAPRFARIPHAGPHCLGIFAQGGAVATLFDPAAVLGAIAGAPAHAVLLRGAGPAVALAVDAALGRMLLARGAADPADDAAAGAIVTLAPVPGGGHAALIDVDQLVERLTGAA